MPEPLPSVLLSEIRSRDAEWRKRVKESGRRGPQSAEDRSVLLALVDGLAADRDAKDRAARLMGEALGKAGVVMLAALDAADEIGPSAGIDVIADYVATAGLEPARSERSGGA
ncbi:hypothetical protein [Nonomuraea bangladeshensis]|uniref:hypothetical protein n=1 Tax=Nonomuraea bangladeshensis TaxID=404385 RepID=UPI003C2CF001